jgi:cytochrome c oxidase cbb3-type subunit I/II
MSTAETEAARSPFGTAAARFRNAVGRFQEFNGSTIDHIEGDNAAKWWIYSAVAWFPIFTTFGLILAIKFVFPNFIGTENWFTFGVVRPAHVNGVLLGFISSGLIGAQLFTLPRVSATRLFAPNIAKIAAVLWNGAVLGGIIGILLGYSQGREYAELPFVSDVILIIVAFLNIYVVLGTVARRGEKKIYVSTWYIMGTVLWFPIFYFIGNVMWHPPVGAINGVQDAILNWYYGHNSFALWFTTMGTALWYYFVPVITRRALDSHATSLVGFFGIAFFYTGIGGHHLLQAPIPEWLKTFAIAMSVGMLIPVAAVASNIVLTMRGAWKQLNGHPIFMFIMFAFFAYIIGSVQGSLQALRSVNAFTHFSQWTVAHSHVTLTAGFGFLAAGAIFWLVPKISGYRLFSFPITRYSFWIGFLGFVMFFWAMVIVGLQQNGNWWYHINVIETLPTLRPVFFARAITGGMVVLAAYLFAFNIFATLIAKRPPIPDDPHEGETITHSPPLEEPPWHPKPYSETSFSTRASEGINMPVLVVSSLAIFAIMTFMVTAVPYMFSPNQPSSSAVPLTAQQMQGKDTYKRLGCVYCHSQFNRPEDWAMGEYSDNGDWYYTVPNFLGTERTGPTLARIGGKRPTEWHIAHYTNPRSVEPRSIMPLFSFLNQDQLNSVASYVQYLGTYNLDTHAYQPVLPLEYRDQSNVFGPVLASVSQAYDPGSDYYSGNPVDAQQYSSIFEQGKLVFTQKCLPCHGCSGNGQGPYAREALARPANIHERIINYPIPQDTFHFWRVSEGVPGTMMPPWGWSLDETTRWKIITYEQSFAYGAVRTVPGDVSDAEGVQFGIEFGNNARISGSQQDFQTGKALYIMFCAQCHGDKGDGNGPASITTGGYISPQPADFNETGSDFETIGQYVWKATQGVETTNMPPWKQAMDDTERYQVIYYIQSFSSADDYNTKWAPLYKDPFAKTVKK